MPERVKWLPNERVDLKDLTKASSEYTSDELRHLLLRAYYGDIPGGTILDGFRIQVPDQTANPGQIIIHNGFALDRTGQDVYKQAGTLGAPENLFERATPTAKTLVLAGAGTHYVEIEFQLVASATDSRAFWDPTYDNGLDTPSGDTLPDGREFSAEVPTRDLIDWKIITNTTGFSWVADLGNGTYSVRVPIARIVITGGGQVDTTSSPLETASTTVISTPVAVGSLPNYCLRVADARLFTSAHSVNITSPTGVARSNGGSPLWPITSIDYNNNVIRLADNPTTVSAKDSVKHTGATAPQFLKPYRGNALSGDHRQRTFSQDNTVRWNSLTHTDTIPGINSEAYIADPTGLTPPTNNYVNSDGVGGANLNAQQDGPYRTDTEIKHLVDWIRAVEYVIREMKHGVTPSQTGDASTEYPIESWVGTHAKGEVDPSRNIPTHGSLAEVANARATHPFKQASHRIYHDTLAERLAADRWATIVVGNGTTNHGDFNGSQGLANALDYIYSTHSDEVGGILHVKAGVYDLSAVTLQTHSLKLAQNWSMIGDGGFTQIRIPATGSFEVVLGEDSTNRRVGAKLKNLVFESTAQRSGTNASLVVFSTSTSGYNAGNWSSALAEISRCVFRNTFGANAIDALGLVRIALGNKSAGPSVRSPINFRDCTLVSGVDGAGGSQTQFEWSYLEADGTTPSSGATVFRSPVCFYDCHFSSPDRTDGPVAYGARIVTEGLDSSIRYGEFKFSNCLFDGLGLISAPASAAARVAGIIAQGKAQGAPPIQLSVEGCTFKGVNAGVPGSAKTNIVAYAGGGIIFDAPKGKLHMSGCKFQDLQWGAWLGSGKHSLSANTFDACAVGVKLGDGNHAGEKYCKTQIAGCTFVGTIEESDQNVAAALLAATTVGIMVSSLDLTRAYGSNANDGTLIGDVLISSSLKVTGSTFAEIGCGINMYPAAALLDTGPWDVDGAIVLDSFEVTGSVFRSIPGCAIDTGFSTVQTTSPAIRRKATVDKLIINGNTFDWCTWECHRDVFTHGGGTYPSNQITHQHQMCVSTNAMRSVVQNNSFTQIGIRVPTDAAPSGYFGAITTGEARRFLAVIGNDPKASTRYVTVSHNTFSGYSNADYGASDPTNLTTYNHNSKYVSWAGCFWVGNKTNTQPTTAVNINISGNSIGGEYLDSSHATDGADRKGQSGFWIGPSAGYDAQSGTLNISSNDIQLNAGQHGIYVSHESTVGGQPGGLSLTDISIKSNTLRSLNPGGASYQAGYPSGSAAGNVQLIKLSNCWAGEGIFPVTASGGVPGTASAVSDSLAVPSIFAQNNSFYIVGKDPATASSGTNLLHGARAGLLVGGFNTTPLITGVNASFLSNVFKSCSLTLGDVTTTGSPAAGVSYMYKVSGNSFVSDIPGTSTDAQGDAGYLRGIFAHNHVHGARPNANARSTDEGSSCAFTNNTIVNGSAVFRAGLNNGVKWVHTSISYYLYLVGNFFHGRGGGKTGADPAVNTVKACFDFLGGDIGGGAAADDIDTPTSGGNLDGWGATEGHNKSIMIALNQFPGAIASTSFIGFGANAVDIGSGGDFAQIGDADKASLLIGGNMSLDVATPATCFNVKGTVL